jgi:hypothetical protein
MAKLEELLEDVADDVVFCGVQATSADHAIVVAVLRSREIEGQDHTFFLIYEAGEWRQHMIRTVTSSVCVESHDLFYALSPYGFVIRLNEDGYESEPIDPSQTHFNSLRHASEIILRHGRLYVAGMGPELFCGGFRRGWASLLAPEVARSPDAELRGFLSAELDDEQLVHAVGFNGEIGYLEANVWREVCSPTNLRLTRVRRSHAGQLLACGSAGVLLHGRKDSWAVVEHGFEDTFWDIAHFGSSTYVASSKGLYTVDAEFEVEGVEFILDEGLTAGFLSASPAALWSVGHQSIARYANEQWTVLWPPASPK